MKKGELTRQMIIEKSAAILNQKGFAATSLADIMAATKLEKGGIYNHFEGKDDLALAAFEYAISLTWGQLRASMQPYTRSIDRLVAFVDAYRVMSVHPPLPGGCPLLNTGIETAYTHPQLRDRVRQAMDFLLRFIARLIARGQESGEIRPDVDGAAIAPLIIGMIEGGVFLARLYQDQSYVDHAVQQTIAYIQMVLATEP